MALAVRMEPLQGAMAGLVQTLDWHILLQASPLCCLKTCASEAHLQKDPKIVETLETLLPRGLQICLAGWCGYC